MYLDYGSVHLAYLDNELCVVANESEILNLPPVPPHQKIKIVDNQIKL